MTIAFGWTGLDAANLSCNRHWLAGFYLGNGFANRKIVVAIRKIQKQVAQGDDAQILQIACRSLANARQGRNGRGKAQGHMGAWYRVPRWQQGQSLSTIR